MGANLISQYLIVSFYDKPDWYTGEIIVVDTEGKNISSPSLFGYFIRLINEEYYKSSLSHFPSIGKQKNRHPQVSSLACGANFNACSRVSLAQLLLWKMRD